MALDERNIGPPFQESNLYITISHMVDSKIGEIYIKMFFISSRVYTYF